MSKIRFWFLIDADAPEGVPETAEYDLLLPDPWSEWFEGRRFYSVGDVQRQLERDRSAGTKGIEPFFPCELALIDYNLAAAPVRSATQMSEEDQAMLLDWAATATSSRGGSSGNDGATRLDGTPSANLDGLFAGSVVASLFRDHPSAVVPTTMYGEQYLRGTYPTLPKLERLLEQLFSVRFVEKGIKRSYEALLTSGVCQLRQSMLAHANAGTALFDVSALSLLALGDPVREIWMESRYVGRRLPVDGLFADFQDHGRRQIEARRWAEDMLRCLFSGLEHELEYRKAIELQDTNYRAFMSPEFESRQHLARLAQSWSTFDFASGESIGDESSLADLCEQWGVELEELRAYSGLRRIADADDSRGKGWWSDSDVDELRQHCDVLGLTLDPGRDDRMPFSVKQLGRSAPAPATHLAEDGLREAALAAVKLDDWQTVNLAIWMLTLRAQLDTRKGRQLIREAWDWDGAGDPACKLLDPMLEELYQLLDPFPGNNVFTPSYGPQNRRDRIRDITLTLSRPDRVDRFWLRLFAAQLGFQQSDFPPWVWDEPPTEDNWPWSEDLQTFAEGNYGRARKSARVSQSQLQVGEGADLPSNTAVSMQLLDPEEAERLADRLIEIAGDQDLECIPLSLLDSHFRGVASESHSLVFSCLRDRSRLSIGPITSELEKLAQSPRSVEAATDFGLTVPPGEEARETLDLWILEADTYREAHERLKMANDALLFHQLRKVKSTYGQDALEAALPILRNAVAYSLQHWDPLREGSAPWDPYVKKHLKWKIGPVFKKAATVRDQLIPLEESIETGVAWSSAREETLDGKTGWEEFVQTLRPIEREALARWHLIPAEYGDSAVADEVEVLSLPERRRLAMLGALRAGGCSPVAFFPAMR